MVEDYGRERVWHAHIMVRKQREKGEAKDGDALLWVIPLVILPTTPHLLIATQLSLPGIQSPSNAQLLAHETFWGPSRYQPQHVPQRR